MNHWDYLTPINLWSYPFMTHSEERRRANRLKLRPVKKPKTASQVFIPPKPDTDMAIIVGERMRLCVELSHRVGRRF